MPLDIQRSDLTLGIVGTGIMGRGIAQIGAQAGVRVVLYDTRVRRRAGGKGLHRDHARQSSREKGRVTPEAAARATGLLEIAHVLPHLSSCHLVIEAIVENLRPSGSSSGISSRWSTDDCLIATNTSSLQVTAIAAACRRPERVGGFHFFNPVPLMKVVEVIGGVLTAPWVIEALTALARRCGHTPVRAADTPGFIVNHAGRGFGTEALQTLREGVAEFYEIDRILRDCAGFRMGPFELFDLTGLDVSHPVMESIYGQYYQEPRYRPSPLTGQRVVAGLLGRKSGQPGVLRVRGRHCQADARRRRAAGAGTQGVDSAARAARRRSPRPSATLGASLDRGDRPGPGVARSSSRPSAWTQRRAALAERADPTRTVAVDALFGLAKRRTLMTTPATAGRCATPRTRSSRATACRCR